MLNKLTSFSALAAILASAVLPSVALAANTIVSATYLDENADGAVEVIRWEFDETVTACAYEAGDWTIDTAGTINVSAVTGISCTGSDAFLDIAVTTDADVTGGATDPVLSYAQAAGTADSVTLTSGALTDKTQSATDDAQPVVINAVYLDDGYFGGVMHDGILDAVTVFLSEDTTFDECENADWALTAMDITGLTLDCAGGFTNLVSAVRLSVTNADIVTGTGGGFEPKIEYVDGGAIPGSLVDASFNELSTDQAAFTLVDAAGPVLSYVEYLDEDEDGKVDAIGFETSEAVLETSVAAPDDFIFVSIGDFTDAAFGVDTTDIITSVTGSFDIPLGTEASVVDTFDDSAAMEVLSQGDFYLYDLVGNGSDQFGEPEYADGASAVIVSVNPADGSRASRSDDITVTFSEPMDTSSFVEGTEFTVTPDPGDFTVTWSDGDRVVKLDPDVSLDSGETYNVVLDDNEIECAENGDRLNLTGPEDGDWSFEVRSSGGGGGGATTVVSTTPTVDLTAPVSGSLVVGEEVDVTWTLTGNITQTVKLEYSTNGGSSYQLIADDIEKSLGTYAWTVPNTVSSNVIVKITAQDSGKGYLDTDVSETLSIVSNEEEVTPEPDGEVLGVTIDAEGRRWAPGSGTFGPSPFDGSNEEISLVESGWYIRGEHYDTVYYVSGDGTRRPFWDAQTFMTWADSWDEVIWVTDATLQTLTLEDPMLPQPGVVLVKISSDPRVYHVEVDTETSVYQLRHVTEEAIASTMFGSNWADYIIDVDPTIFTHYEAGTAITFAEEVDTSDMETRLEVAAQVAAE